MLYTLLFGIICSECVVSVTAESRFFLQGEREREREREG